MVSSFTAILVILMAAVLPRLAEAKGIEYDEHRAPVCYSGSSYYIEAGNALSDLRRYVERKIDRSFKTNCKSYREGTDDLMLSCLIVDNEGRARGLVEISSCLGGEPPFTLWDSRKASSSTKRRQ